MSNDNTCERCGGSKDNFMVASAAVSGHIIKLCICGPEPDPLQAVSNVIELKPDKTYLLVFKIEQTGRLVEQFTNLSKRLKAMGIEHLFIAVSDEHELTVIEASKQ